MQEILAQAYAIKAKIEELPSAKVGDLGMRWDFKEDALSILVAYNPNTDTYIGIFYGFYVYKVSELTDEWLADLEQKMHEYRLKFWKEQYNIILPPRNL
jgi:hypothetical protein